MGQRPKELDNRVIILNGFSDEEIVAIMNAVKSLYADADFEAFSRFERTASDHPAATDFSRRLLRVIAAGKQLEATQKVSPRDLIFAKSTESSLQMKLANLIIDMSGDHEYLKNNPPQPDRRSEAGSSD